MKIGDEFGPSSWVVVDQDRINAFADATGDHQWIHVDPERAAAGPFGQTIGHGYLTLSLVPVMSYEVLPHEEGGMGINYGVNKVRFPAPVPSGSKVRGTFRVDNVEELVEHGNDQGQGQEPVRDGAAERARRGPLAVHMDPLVIVGRVGERVDPVLGDLQPAGVPDVGPGQRLELVQAVSGGGHAVLLWVP